MGNRFTLIFLVLFSCFSCLKEGKVDSHDVTNYNDLFASAYRTNEKKEILKIIDLIKNQYKDNELVQSYYINLAQLYYQAGENEKALETLELEHGIIKYFYLGTLQNKIGRKKQSKVNLEKFYSELNNNSNKTFDQTIVVITSRLLGYDLPKIEPHEADAQIDIISGMSNDELLASIWP